ncbi:TPA: molecular chaperone [Citrobacter pasteurii]
MSTIMRLVVAGSLFLSISSQASIVLGGTRIIYSSDQKEVQIPLKNKDEHTRYLVQSWVSNIDDSKAPFVITPPVYKMNENRQTLLHVIFTGDKNSLARDRETLFLANIKSVAAMPEELKNKNTLQFAMKTRLKLFWRPESLDVTSALTAWEKLRFRKEGSRLIAKNPTPFYISLGTLSVGGKIVRAETTKNEPNALSMMVAPFSEQQFRLPSGGGSTVEWSAINDYGADTGQHRQTL